MDNRVIFGKGSDCNKDKKCLSQLRNLGVDIFSLVFDARIPCETNGKGYKEGPHFPLIPVNHVCDSAVVECVLYQYHLERILRDKKNANFVFDVIMLPSCCKSDIDNLRIEACMSKPYLLLERWFINFVKSDSLSERPLKEIENLYQAIYSHVHYSQLSSWLSLNNGSIPMSIFYWVKLPGDTSMKSFITIPKFHNFPAYMVTDEFAISVSVHSFPRTEIVPRHLCSEISRLLCGEHYMSQAVLSLNYQPSICRQSTCNKNVCLGSKTTVTGNDESSHGQNSLKVEDTKKKKRKIKKDLITSTINGTRRNGELHEIEKFPVSSCSSIHHPENVTAPPEIKHKPKVCQKSENEASDQYSKVKNNSKHLQTDNGCDDSTREKLYRNFYSRVSLTKCGENSAISEATINGTERCENKPIEIPAHALISTSSSKINGMLDESNQIKVLNCNSVVHSNENLTTTVKIKRKLPLKSVYERCYKKLYSGKSSAAKCEEPNVSYYMNTNGVQYSENKPIVVNGQQIVGNSYTDNDIDFRQLPTMASSALHEATAVSYIHSSTLEAHDISHQGIFVSNSEERRNLITSSTHETTNKLVPSEVNRMFGEPHASKKNFINSSTHETTKQLVPNKVNGMFGEPHVPQILNSSVIHSAKMLPEAAEIKQKSPLKSLNKTNNHQFKVSNKKVPCKRYYSGISSSECSKKTCTSQISVNGNHSSEIQAKQINGQESLKYWYHLTIGQEGNMSYSAITVDEREGATSAKDLQYCMERYSALPDTANEFQILSNIPTHNNASYEAVDMRTKKDLKMSETSGSSTLNCVNKKRCNFKSGKNNCSKLKFTEKTVNAVGKCDKSSNLDCFMGAVDSRASRSSTRKQFAKNSQSLETKSVLSRLTVKPKRENVEWLPVRNSSPYPDEDRVKESKPVRSKELLINFEESLLHGCFKKVRSASGYEMYGHIPDSLHPVKFSFPVDVTFYEVDDAPRGLAPLLGVASVTDKVPVPKKGCLEVTVFRPCDRVLRDFTVKYNLKSMPNKCQAFIRQRTWFMPKNPQPNSYRKLRYIINIWVESNATGKFFLCKDIKVAIVDVPVMSVETNEHWEIETEVELVCQ